MLTLPLSLMTCMPSNEAQKRLYESFVSIPWRIILSIQCRSTPGSMTILLIDIIIDDQEVLENCETLF